MKSSTQQRGFTIVELLIAMTVFATILLLLTTGLIQIGRTYYKGVTSSRVQENARAIIEDISQAIQYEGGTVVPSITPAITGNTNMGGFCVGTRRFSYLKNAKVVDSSPTSGQTLHALVADPLSSCNAGTTSLDLTASTALPAGAKELVSREHRLARISVETTGSANVYKVTVRVVAGDNDLLIDALGADGNPGSDGVLDTCNNTVRQGTQFCAVSELSTTVQKRVQ